MFSIQRTTSCFWHGLLMSSLLLSVVLASGADVGQETLPLDAPASLQAETIKSYSRASAHWMSYMKRMQGSQAAHLSERKAYKRSKGSQSYHGKGTFFKPNHGACGDHNNSHDLIVALSADVYDHGAHCGKTIRACYKGKCVNAKVTDLCPGCPRTSLDMSPAAFASIANKDEGIINLQWSFH